jgi:SAM-dependent methyltransferase
MLSEEAKIIYALCTSAHGRRILNVCSSGEDFYKREQPFIWDLLLGPLSENNQLTNLDIKAEPGVDIVADCRHMTEIPESEYDIVLFCSGIEHMRKPEKAVEEIRRILRKDGFAVFSAPGVYPKHKDPIDTMLRFPDKKTWSLFLGDGWEIDDFRATEPEAAKPFYHFDRNVYATIVRCRPRCR